MNHTLNTLHKSIEAARSSFIHSASGLTSLQAKFKPSEQEWSILEITEHIVWAEQIGICGMFKAIEGVLETKPIWEGNSPNEGLSIEQIVEKTWQPKEKVPKVAEPKWGGTLDFWITGLKNNTSLLNELIIKANSIDLSKAIYPHPISGPMNVIQRLEFLRFHLERHEGQIKRVKSSTYFPG